MNRCECFIGITEGGRVGRGGGGERERESGSREEGKGAWNRERSSVKRGDRLERKVGVE